MQAVRRDKAVPRVLEEQRRLREEQRMWLTQRISAVERERDALLQVLDT